LNTTCKPAHTLGWLLIAGSFLLLYTSCKKKTESQADERVVARVFERYLYANDLRNIVPKGTSRNDSLRIINDYVNNWIRQECVLKRAEDNLAEEKKDVERKLEEYRNSLITFIYEKELVKQKLDTTVSSAEIEKYYKENENSFQLRNNILQVLYVKVPVKAPKLDKLRQWFRSSDAKDRKLMEEYSFQYASDYFFNDEEWMLFDDLIQRVPIKTYDQEQFLRNNRIIEIPDSNHVFLVHIKGFKIKESISPLSFETDNIRNLILNQRKLDLLREMENDAYNDALKAEQIESWVR
jgi:hypothetical protein